MNSSNLVQAQQLPIKAKKKKNTKINRHIGWYILIHGDDLFYSSK